MYVVSNTITDNLKTVACEIRLFTLMLPDVVRGKLTWRLRRATRSRLGSSGVKRTVISSFILMGRPDMGHSTVLL